MLFDEWNNFSVNVALDNIVIMDEISKFAILLCVRNIGVVINIVAIPVEIG